jgi:hypothetical protein
MEVRSCGTISSRVESVDRDPFELINKRQRPMGVEPIDDRQAATVGYVRNVSSGSFARESTAASARR